MTRPANKLPPLEPSASREAVIRNVIAVAKSQVGYREGHDASGWTNDNVYSKTINGWWGYAWCVDFANWSVINAGYPSLIYRTSSCGAYWSWAKRNGRVGNSGSNPPEPGDFIDFTGGSTGHRHFGLIAEVHSTYLVTYEGNTNTNGSAEGDGVYRKIRPRVSGSYDTIRLDWDKVVTGPPPTGPSTPKPPTIPTKPAPVKVKGWAHITGIRSDQTVNGRSGPGLGYDAIYQAHLGHRFYYADIVKSGTGTWYRSNKGTYYLSHYVTKGR